LFRPSYLSGIVVLTTVKNYFPVSASNINIGLGLPFPKATLVKRFSTSINKFISSASS
jgi:hypothetical protein